MARQFLITASAGLSFACPGLPAEAHPHEHCSTVRGSYAIFANHDLLRIDGSRHFIEVTSAALDKELERRGWESTRAMGWFAICSPRRVAARELTARDAVELRSFHRIEFQNASRQD